MFKNKRPAPKTVPVIYNPSPIAIPEPIPEPKSKPKFYQI